MDEVLCVLITILLGTFTCSPTPGVKYTLYSVQETWNEARAICETQGQDMLKLDISEKFSNFMVYLDLWLNSGVLKGDLWTGLHRRIITNYSAYNLDWYDCEPLGEWTKWARGEPDNQDVQLCVRLTISYFEFRTIACDRAWQAVCQHNTEFQNKKVVDENLASTFDDTLDGCKQFCLDFSVDSSECVLITFSGNLHGVCRIYTGSYVFVQNQPNMTEEQGINVFIKRCVFGEYHSTAPSVEANTASEPITVCPASTETAIPSPSSSSTTDIPSIASTLHLYTENIQQTDMTTENTDHQSLTFEKRFSSALGSAQMTQLSPSKLYVTSIVEQLGTSAASHIHSNTDAVSSPEAEVTESTPVHITPPLQYDTDTKLSLVSLPSLNDVHQPISSLNSEPISDLTDLESIVSSSDLGSILPGLSHQHPRWTSSENLHSSSSVVLLDSTATILSSSLENNEIQTSVVYNVTTMTTNAHQNGTATNALCHCFCAKKDRDISVIVHSPNTLLDKKSLTSYWRSKNSAQDDRMSAQAIGSSGIVIIIIAVSFIVCMDLDKLLRVKNRRRKT